MRTEITVGPGGEPLAIGRPTRTIRGPLRTLLIARDGGCRFPGCTRPPEWCDGHHIVRKALGGPTVLENLVLLCRFHHRCVHEGGWRIVRVSEHGFTFVPPGGRSP